jgi:DNA polymerase
MKHATIDFETRSTAPITDVGAMAYARHASTSVLWLAYNTTGNPADTKLWKPSTWHTDAPKPDHAANPCPTELLRHIAANGLVEAHNSGFEYCIWNYVCTKLYGWPALPLEQLRCSAAKARSAGLPGSLGGAGEALNLQVQKDKNGTRLIKLLCMPQKPTKNKPDIWVNDEFEMLELGDYCATDVNTEMELSAKLPEMIPAEIDTWLMDQRMNMRGVYIDKPAVENTLKIIDQANDKYLSRIPIITNGEIKTAGQRAKILDWCAAQGFPLPGYTKEDVERALAKPNIPANVKELLEIRQILGLSSTAKYTAMLTRMCDDGAVYDNLIYHKAHTGRWGGSGVQVHNLPRPTIDAPPEDLVDVLMSGSLEEVEAWYDNPLEVASSAIRSMIMARPGMQFIAADYAAIEARMLFWLAKDEEALDIFRRGECIYCEMASTIFHIPAKEIQEGYKADDFKLTKMRKSGKDAILGLGYQMGGPKFYQQNSPSDPTLTLEFSKEVVGLYRERFYKVPQLWEACNDAAMEALANGGRAATTVSGNSAIKFRYDGYWLKCKLPSGRCIHYPAASIKLKKTDWGQLKEVITYKTYDKGIWKDTTTYGGKLVENIDQACSRDIMANGLKEAEQAGYPPLMTVHDEGVTEVPEGYGSLQEYSKLLCTLPPWAKGLPLKSSGWCGKRYRK